MSFHANSSSIQTFCWIDNENLSTQLIDPTFSLTPTLKRQLNNDAKRKLKQDAESGTSEIIENLLENLSSSTICARTFEYESLQIREAEDLDKQKHFRVLGLLVVCLKVIAFSSHRKLTSVKFLLRKNIMHTCRRRRYHDIMTYVVRGEEKELTSWKHKQIFLHRLRLSTEFSLQRKKR